MNPQVTAFDNEKSTSDRSGFHVLTKPTGPICNLNCEYCYYLEKEKLYPQISDWAMQGAVLESFIQQYIKAQDVPVITFAWQGGEPTILGVDYFRRILELQRRYADGKEIQNALQTNGILLDDQWGEFLGECGFLVGISIDGPERLHDKYRVDKGGEPTFDRVLRGIGLLNKHGVQYNTLTVVHRENSYHPLPVYHFLKELAPCLMQFIPLVERVAAPDPNGLVLLAPGSAQKSRVTDWSVESKQYGRFLCTVFDDWVRRDVGRHFVQLFEVSLESWLGIPQSLCVFSETCGRALAIEHNGDLYSCDHYVYPENRLGNIMESPLESLLISPSQTKFGQDKRSKLPRFCLECDVRFACNGECPKHRFLRTPDGEDGLNYLCAGYKLFFGHIAPYMKFMAQELRQQRSPSNVMTWAANRDLSKSKRDLPSRNGPCLCGSGLKYKKCCGAPLTH